MDKILVVVFDNESKAYEGSKALQALQDEGSINLYAKAVIARDAGGKVEVKEAGDSGPVGTAVGLLTGSLIGLIGGPVGLAIGAYAGTLGRHGVRPGERRGWRGFPARSRAIPAARQGSRRSRSLGGLGVAGRDAHGGLGWRRVPPHAWGNRRCPNRAGTLRRSGPSLPCCEAEDEKASAEAKAKLRAKIDAVKAKLQAMQGAIEARLEASKQETEAKIKSLREQAAKRTRRTESQVGERVSPNCRLSRSGAVTCSSKRGYSSRRPLTA